jgi:hypothetical protein
MSAIAAIGRRQMREPGRPGRAAGARLIGQERHEEHDRLSAGVFVFFVWVGG